ncbi:GntR family transcriptional regulator [Neobacillus vireti]|uniref:GntR family transcriptional regulator n=1 Tax=Neobacillus vireti LMG 21834 TaxID=1131730 RepID=A0AB94ISJ3_9BACI|nr:GntR family transcriptional regulator [Neobacillus vireti]ETI69947.1 GntR family transcriptional regulator [Neobacillus vireti LMG 21834]KLT18013.1 transcriptional regulator [Neobacillus vireti]
MSKQLAVENAYLFLKQRILDGTYKPSEKLNELELTEAIKVSRNTVKKALLMLEQENLVKMEKNKGAYIKSFTLEEIINYLKIREVLEGLVIKDATVNITASDLHEMENILQTMGDYLKENLFDEYSNLNKEFHNIIYGATTNTQAVEMIRMLKIQLSRFHLRTILVPGRNAESYEEHKNIVAALKNRDENAAEEAVKKHIANVRLTIEKNYMYLL